MLSLYSFDILKIGASKMEVESCKKIKFMKLKATNCHQNTHFFGGILICVDVNKNIQYKSIRI